MQLLPAIDLRGGRVVRLMQGDYDRQTTYADDPLAVARSFEDAFAAAGVDDGPRWLHVVDLDAAKTGELSPGTRETLASLVKNTSLSVEFGGGVRSTAIVDELLGLGVARVVIGSAALKDWSWFAGLLGTERYRHRIALGLDAKAGMVAVSGWTETSGERALDVALKAARFGDALGAIIYTDIATDGTLQGPSYESTRELADAVQSLRGGVDVIASGGVGHLEHVERLAGLPVRGAIVGRAIYEGTIDLAEAIRSARQIQPSFSEESV